MSQKAWEPQPGEPSRWFARFEVYRLLGTTRTVEEAFRRCAEIEGLQAARPGSIWYVTAAEWKWAERAAGWDGEQREALRTQDGERRFDLRERRLAYIDELLVAAFRVLALANLPDMTQAEAREWLPFARLLFGDMLKAERTEIGLPVTPTTADAGEGVGFTADDLRRAQVELEQWQAGGESGAADAPPAEALPVEAPAKPAHRTLLVCVGPDAALMVDLAALRAVKAATGLAFHRILDVKREDFDAYLRRERAKGRPVELLHLAVHAGHTGVHFADGPVDGEWLSERLLGVRVLLLAGCEGDRIGDWLGVVPYVVTLAEPIGHQDAGVLTEAFWMGIGRCMTPDAALDAALAKCAPAVSEYVVRHW